MKSGLRARAMALGSIINQPPLCDADGPYQAECAGGTTSVVLDGTGRGSSITPPVRKRSQPTPQARRPLRAWLGLGRAHAVRRRLACEITAHEPRYRASRTPGRGRGCATAPSCDRPRYFAVVASG